MCAPNRPVATSPSWSRARSTSSENSRSPSAGSAAVALVRVGSQRELRHQQQATARLAQVEVHAAFTVREDTVGEYPFEQALGLLGRIAALHAHEGEQARADCPDHLAINMNGGFGYPLQQCNHE
jgi:hypothetical protein